MNLIFTRQNDKGTITVARDDAGKVYGAYSGLGTPLKKVFIERLFTMKNADGSDMRPWARDAAGNVVRDATGARVQDQNADPIWVGADQYYADAEPIDVIVRSPIRPTLAPWRNHPTTYQPILGLFTHTVKAPGSGVTFALMENENELIAQALGESAEPSSAMLEDARAMAELDATNKIRRDFDSLDCQLGGTFFYCHHSSVRTKLLSAYRDELDRLNPTLTYRSITDVHFPR